MEYDFQSIIGMLNANIPSGDNFAFRLARNANAPGDLLFNKMLPRENRASWHTSGGTMTITPTILNDVAMDSDPAPMGNLESSLFSEKISKFGGQMFFNEAQQREWIEMENDIRLSASREGLNVAGDMEGQLRMFGETGMADSNTINGRRLNIIANVIRSMQLSHFNTSEWLGGEALTEGKIEYNFSGLEMKIDYKIPSTQIKDYSGNDRFDQSASKWWTFVRYCYKTFRNPMFYMNSNSYYDIVENDVNKIQEQFITGDVRPMSKYRDDAVTQKQDANERVNVNIYDKAGAIMDVSTKSLTTKPFLKNKRVVVIGELNTSQIELTLGGVTDPDNNLRIGYTHVGPTVEGGGRSGIYANIYTLPHKPQQIFTDTYVNMLPVILNPKKIIIAKFD